MGIIKLISDEWKEKISLETVKAEMSVKPEDNTYDEYILELLNEAKEIGKPLAVVRECTTEYISEELMHVDGITFQSKLAIEKLKGSAKVYSYVVSCGRELHDWSVQYDADPLNEFIASSIMKAAIPFGFSQLTKWIKENTAIEKYSAINPGSLPSWPITAQKQVFGLLAGKENNYEPSFLKDFAGVELKESFLMVPLKSVSGIIFNSTQEWHNCMRCSKKDCPDRRAEMTIDAEDMISEAGKVENIKI